MVYLFCSSLAILYSNLTIFICFFIPLDMSSDVEGRNDSGRLCGRTSRTMEREETENTADKTEAEELERLRQVS